MDEEQKTDKEASVAADASTVNPEIGGDDAKLLEKYERTFIGSFSHSLDAKGRIIVPVCYRKELGDTFYVGPTFDFKAIALYPNLVWAQIRDGYAKLGRLNRALNAYTEQFDALSYRGQECDAQGRVLLPVKIRQLILKDEKDVEITGAQDHVRIVGRVASEDQTRAFLDSLPDILDVIGSLSGQV